MKILAFGNGSGSSWWRLESVAKYIDGYDGHDMLVLSNKDWNGRTGGADIVVWQMVVNPEVINDCHKQGAKVIYEADDLITERLSRKELQNPHEFLAQTRAAIAACDMVTTTTEPLAIELRKINPNVVVLPNYMDDEWWGPASNIRHRGKIRIGWAGSTSHKSDLEFVSPIMERILNEFPEAHFVYCGAGGVSSSSLSTELMYGDDTFRKIPTNRREFFLGVNTELWPIKSKTLHFDIGIAPLISDKFNDCKSNIKWQEYSLNGWAGVYSDEPPYSDIKHALKAKDQEEFYQKIKYLIEHPVEREQMAQRAMKEVKRSWLLKNNFTKWIKAYQKCLNQ
jgi:glycosyltransferase involved in cell wall biosynthesis